MIRQHIPLFSLLFSSAWYVLLVRGHGAVYQGSGYVYGGATGQGRQPELRARLRRDRGGEAQDLANHILLQALLQPGTLAQSRQHQLRLQGQRCNMSAGKSIVLWIFDTFDYYSGNENDFFKIFEGELLWLT